MRYEEFILTDNIHVVKTKIAKLNKRAVKLNVLPITINVTNETKIEVIKDVHNGKDYETTFHFTKVIIEGEEPKLAGWNLVAVKNNDPDMGLMINSVPEKEMPVEFRESGTPCAHCGHNRIRHTTYILEKDLKELTDDEMVKYL